MENFILVSKTAQGWYYATLLAWGHGKTIQWRRKGGARGAGAPPIITICDVTVSRDPILTFSEHVR